MRTALAWLVLGLVCVGCAERPQDTSTTTTTTAAAPVKHPVPQLKSMKKLDMPHFQPVAAHHPPPLTAAVDGGGAHDAPSGETAK